jgi:hypothetical protein
LQQILKTYLVMRRLKKTPEYFAGRAEFLWNSIMAVIHGVFRCLTLKDNPSDALRKAKWRVKFMKSKMSSSTAKSILVGSLKEFVSNPVYYRYSHVGMEYSEITEAGSSELKKIMELNLSLLRDSMEWDRTESAKDLMMEQLKK